VVVEFVTLGGVMQGYREDRSGGFQLGGWQVPYFDKPLGGAVVQSLAASGAVPRPTHEIFAAHWPEAPAEDSAQDLRPGASRCSSSAYHTWRAS
jgi:hypothetical protein